MGSVLSIFLELCLKMVKNNITSANTDVILM